MSRMKTNFNDECERGLFAGLDNNRFVQINPTIAKEINLSIPLGIYGGTKKDEHPNTNIIKKSSFMYMEQIPINNFVNYELIDQEKNKLISEKVAVSVTSQIEKKPQEFDTIKKNYNNRKYIPIEYSEKKIFENDYENQYSMKSLIKQATGQITEDVARNCRATGIGLKKAVAGEITQIIIYSFSEDNKIVNYGGYDFRVFLTPFKYTNGIESSDQFSLVSLELMDINETFEGSVIDNNDGTYTVSYICRKAVPHKLEIFDNKKKISIGESPFVVKVSPGKAYPELCWAEGDGLINYNINEEISSFIIHSIDRMGNKLKSGGDKYEVIGVGGIKIQQILDLKNGDYEVLYKVNQCNLDDYKEINIKLFGQDIKTPVFYPRAKFNESQDLYRKRESIYDKKLLNKTIIEFDSLSIDIKPAYTLSMVFNHFEEMKKMGNDDDISIPNLVPFPEGKEKENNCEIVRRLINSNELFNTKLNDYVILNEKVGSSTLDYYKNVTLKNIANKLQKNEEILNDLSKVIIMHCETAKVHDEKLIKDERKLEMELDEITDCQQRMFATYSCLQQGGIDSLPVSFELEDPEKIKERQKKDRKFYVDTYNSLEKKFEEIKSRKETFEKKRDEYTHKLHKTLVTRQKSIIKTQRTYNRILDELDRIYLQLSKKQVRRQDLFKNLRPESLYVFEGLQNQKIIDKILKKDTIIISNSTNVKEEKNNGIELENNFKRVMGKNRKYNNYSCLVPNDPESPAFWFAEASYLRDEKEKLSKYINHEEKITGDLTDYPQKVKRWDLDEDSRWISCPSSVSITFSTLKTPDIQPIKQKGMFKNDVKLEEVEKDEESIVKSQKRDPMLPEDLSQEELDNILKIQKENKRILKKIDKNTKQENIYLSDWVESPPRPYSIVSFFDKSLDEKNKAEFLGGMTNPKSDSDEFNENNKLKMENNIDDCNEININLINAEVKLLPSEFWDRDFMFNLNKDAKKPEDFERIRNIWKNNLEPNRELRKKIIEERKKFMQLVPNKGNKARSEFIQDEEGFTENNDNITDNEWGYLHHTFEHDPKCVPWEFLGEISKMTTIPSKQISKEELQKYIVESLVLEGDSLSKKRDVIKNKLDEEEAKRLNEAQLEMNKARKKTIKILDFEQERVNSPNNISKNSTAKTNSKKQSNARGKIIIGRKNFDTRREQFEHDNVNLN
ncbi:dictyostelium gelation factor like filamin type immunoglobulin domain [Cryptosporidium ryanae]|uniref:dictyostelium gelation factor like filamin type immunoglobulin domain n=1 Tax=Cryptosporidium ryanae TaxID=515981 RepID=UPI00351A27D1|nr:dictyostelium gelation factor like filamin type immunoglobulin domain [Cryptosporidium ryanae]